jgi:hypothetical protein
MVPPTMASPRLSSAYALASMFLAHRRSSKILCGHARHANATSQEQLHPASLLQSLEVPYIVWADVVMDFMEGFPRINDKPVILTIADRFSKYNHFIPLGHSYTATIFMKAFFDTIIHLHGIPCSIVPDRDLVFMSQFWREVFWLAGIKLPV